ncbi:MAG: PEP-CTERM sorting domain-containing protein [Verrucomicrobiaceae bacterium]|nr:PEP-CTERM sorting domain-containing protein [Verrucomicrobiaceae bacterium]
MRLSFALSVLLAVASVAPAATVTFDNLNGGGDAAYGVRDAAGTLISGSGFSGVMGRFTISDSTIQSNFASGNVAAISTGFSAFDPVGGTFALDSLAAGAFQTSESFDTKASTNTFGGSSIYAVFYKGASIATATELLIAKLSSAFPTDPEVGLALTGAASFSPSGITSLLVGTSGGAPHDYGIGGGALPTYGLSLVNAAPEPSRAMLAGLGLMGLVIRRRRK